ncbi:MAG: rRNA (guanine-N1)-methyltransferase [Proteobacteria bacterium]|nr:MAG: rRNA (guanine-N1)-methyltransferase [Pseudomonadota bacterium]
MEVAPYSSIVCPIDQSPLALEEKTYRCENGHSFDRAREGYVNLLSVQWKGSKNPGDDKLMTEARARFLRAGHYEPLMSALASLAQNELSGREEAQLVDAGCGEGAYLRYLGEAARSWAGGALSLSGYDISKPAIIAAAKEKGPISFFVAGHRHPPYATGSLSGMLSVFAFPDWHAFAKLLEIGGFVLTAEAGTDHLRELREVLYEEVREARSANHEAPVAAGFTLSHAQNCRFELALKSEAAIADLFKMTPHYYRVTEEAKARALALPALALTVDVRLELWRKT